MALTKTERCTKCGGSFETFKGSPSYYSLICWRCSRKGLVNVLEQLKLEAERMLIAKIPEPRLARATMNRLEFEVLRDQVHKKIANSEVDYWREVVKRIGALT